MTANTFQQGGAATANEVANQSMKFGINVINPEGDQVVDQVLHVTQINPANGTNVEKGLESLAEKDGEQLSQTSIGTDDPFPSVSDDESVTSSGEAKQSKKSTRLHAMPFKQCGVALTVEKVHSDENAEKGKVSISVSDLKDADVVNEIKGYLAHYGLVVLKGAAQSSDRDAAEQRDGLVDWVASDMKEFFSNFVKPGDMLAFDSAKRPTVDGSAEGTGYVRKLGNLGKDASGNEQTALADVNYEWHSDGEMPFQADSLVSPVAMYSLLHCKQQPPKQGGETFFAAGEKMLTKLSAEEQDLAKRLVCVTSNRFTAGGPCSIDVEHGLQMTKLGTKLKTEAHSRREGWGLNEGRTRLAHWVYHCPNEGSDECPTPREGSATGKQLRAHLAVGAKNLDHFEEMESETSSAIKKVYSVAESRAMLDRFLKKGMLRPDVDLAVLESTKADDADTSVWIDEFDYENVVFAMKWRPGDAVLWDNRMVLHTTTPTALYRPRNAPREMWQLLGVGSTGTAGSELNPEGNATSCSKVISSCATQHFQKYYMLGGSKGEPPKEFAKCLWRKGEVSSEEQRFSAFQF